MTDLHIFYTTKDPGITAAMRWTGGDGSTYIIGHDVRLSSIADYTTRLTLGTRGSVALFLNDGKIIAPPHDPRFSNAAKINQAVLKTADELDLPELAEGFRRWQADPNPDSKLHAFSRPDGRWLSLFQPIQSNGHQVWLGTVAPESDFVPITRQDLWLLGLITVLAVMLGMAVAVRVAGRFGEPLAALADDSERIGRLDLDQPISTDAPGERSPNWPARWSKCGSNCAMAARRSKKPMPSLNTRLPNARWPCARARKAYKRGRLSSGPFSTMPRSALSASARITDRSWLTAPLPISSITRSIPCSSNRMPRCSRQQNGSE